MEFWCAIVFAIVNTFGEVVRDAKVTLSGGGYDSAATPVVIYNVQSNNVTSHHMGQPVCRVNWHSRKVAWNGLFFFLQGKPIATCLIS